MWTVMAQRDIRVLFVKAKTDYAPPWSYLSPSPSGPHVEHSRAATVGALLLLLLQLQWLSSSSQHLGSERRSAHCSVMDNWRSQARCPSYADDAAVLRLLIRRQHRRVSSPKTLTRSVSSLLNRYSVFRNNKTQNSWQLCQFWTDSRSSFTDRLDCKFGVK